MSHYDDERMLHQQRIIAHDKYTYFLLATAAAAIAFSVQQTAGDEIAWSQLPLAAAVGAWAYSFWCGCKRINTVDRSMSMNITAIQQRIDVEAQNPPGPIREAYVQMVRDVLDKVQNPVADLGQRYWNHQFSAIVAGAVCFVLWHIVEMILRRTSTPPVVWSAGVDWV